MRKEHVNVQYYKFPSIILRISSYNYLDYISLLAVNIIEELYLCFSNSFREYPLLPARKKEQERKKERERERERNCNWTIKKEEKKYVKRIVK